MSIPEMPAFLRRDSKEFRALAKKASKRVVAAATTETADPDEKLHELAASMGLKRHQYQVDWLRDPKWVEAYKEISAERTAEREAKAEKRKAEKVPKAPKPKKQKPATVKLSKLPQGRIVVLKTDNPKQKGSEPWERWNALLTQYGGRTVEAYVLDGKHPKALENAIKSGHVKVVRDGDETEPASAGTAPAGKQPRAKQKGSQAVGPAPAGAGKTAREKAAKPRKAAKTRAKGK